MPSSSVAATSSRRRRIRKSDYFIPKPDRRAEIVESRDEYTPGSVFWAPEGARWEYLQSQAKQPTIGVLLDAKMDEIEKENPTLRGQAPVHP